MNYIKQSMTWSLIRSIKREIIYEKRDKQNFNKRKINKKLNKNPRLAFIIQYPEVWNSLKSIHTYAKQQNLETLIICVPKRKDISKKISELNIENINEAYEFLNNERDAINAYINDWFNLKEWKPDLVFYSRPYNADYPDLYKSSTVYQYTNVCLVPYGFTLLNGFVFSVSYNFEFLLNTDYLVCQSGNQYKECKKRFIWQSFKKRLHILNYGYPRFDLLTSKIDNNLDKDKFTVLWVPRWEFENIKGQKLSHFFSYLDDWILFIKKYKDINFIFRPHPLMFIKIVQDKIMTEEEVNQLITTLNSYSNLTIDTNKDYLLSLRKSDVMVADFTSLIAEYFIMGKPIIYCDTTENFNKDGKLIAPTLYYADKWSDIENRILRLKQGDDKKEAKRKQTISKIIPSHSGNIGKEVLMQIINTNNDLY